MCFVVAICRTAAEAALARIQSQKHDTTHFNTSLAAIRAQVQRELEAERKVKSELEKGDNHEMNQQPKVLDDGHNRNLAAQGVYFRFVFTQSNHIQIICYICEAHKFRISLQKLDKFGHVPKWHSSKFSSLFTFFVKIIPMNRSKCSADIPNGSLTLAQISSSHSF